MLNSRHSLSFFCLIFTLFLALFLQQCSSPNQKVQSQDSTTNSAVNSTIIGAPICNQVLQKFEACIQKKVKIKYQSTYMKDLENWRKNWKKLAQAKSLNKKDKRDKKDKKNLDQLEKACLETKKKLQAFFKKHQCL